MDSVINYHEHTNTDAPLNKMPHELLVMVFEQVLAAHLPVSPISFPIIDHDGYTPILRTLRVITEVCHLWRDVALGTPALWTLIDSRGYPEDELRRLVQRSDPLPMTLFLHNTCDSSTFIATSLSLLRAISQRLHRVDFNFDANRPVVSPSDIEELLSFDGSVLQCLTVSCRTAGQSFVWTKTTHVFPILLAHADSLQALAIVPSVGWIPANHFPRLTHLYLSFYPIVRAPHRLDILCLLHNTPCLEILHLHRLGHRQGPPINELWQAAPLHVELPSLRSLVFTHSAYKPVMGVLDGLSLPSRALVRLDNLYIPFNSEYPAPIPRSLSEPLGRITAMQLAVDKEMLFLVVEGGSPESGLWLRVRHEANTFWSHWLSGLHATVPLGNLTSLHIDLYDPFVLTVLSHMTQLSDLFVLLEPDKVAEERVRINALVPRVATFCSVLSQSQPMACPSLRSLVLEWRRDTLTYLEDLGVPDIVAMLSSRASFGHPVRRLVIQAIPAPSAESGSTLRSYFSEQLSPLAGHVEEFEDCVDCDVHVCAFEMREMWNVTGAEDYWCVNERQRPRYIPLRSYDYSFTS